MAKCIAVDIDDVCLNLIDPWLKLYNDEYEDNLRKDQITDWDISSFCKPGSNIYKYVDDPALFLAAKPVDGALEAIQTLRKRYKVIFVTACTPKGHPGTKLEWLIKNKFLNQTRESESSYYERTEKSLPDLDADYLLDDGFHNIQAFHNDLRTGFLFNANWNKKYRWFPRVFSWSDFLYLMDD